MIVKYYNTTGKEKSTGFDLPNSIFSVKVNKALLSHYVYAYLANQRQSNANTKDRGEVSGGGKKPWNQKGTGRARAGSNRSPLWKGGGVTFGPSNERNYKKTLSKKMVKATFRSAFSLSAENKSLAVMENIDLKEANTKKLLATLEGLLKLGKTTLVQNGANENLLMSGRNIKNLQIVNVNELNPYQILNSKNLVLLENTLDVIKKNWIGKEIKVVKKKIKVVEKPVKKVVKKVAKKVTITKKINKT